MSRHMAAVHGSLKPVRMPPSMTAAQAAPKRPAKPLPNLIPIQAVQTPTPAVQTATASPPSSTPAAAVNGEDGHETTKKKNSFFDQLKLYPGAVGGASDLVCVHCGHEAKCVSELVRHNKLHQGGSRALGTSTRCQHCRHRCKTSADLAAHLKTCAKAAAAVAASKEDADVVDFEDAGAVNHMPAAESDVGAEIESKNVSSTDNACTEDADDEDADSELPPLPEGSIPKADPTLVGVETAPGHGLVTNQAEYEARAARENVVTTAVSPRKVFKCPHCPFWAATASRFHVHMVGHLNKKPFACSVCKYRSNWRWDITKHIRIKEARDPEHANAKTLMSDETGRRNYSKYNQHLLMLKVAEPSAENLTPMFDVSSLPSNGIANGSHADVSVKQTSDPVSILPAPPKLTRAPTPRSVSHGTSSSSGVLLRPPPPLQAAAQPPTHLILLPPGVRVGQAASQQLQGQGGLQQQQPSLKRPAETPPSNVGSDPKRSNTEIKKTVWRCKQCHFRDGDRAVVLAHVKGHYRQQQEAALAKLKSTSGNLQAHSTKAPSDTQQAVIKKVPFRCDTCPFVSVSESQMQAHVNCHKERCDVFFKCFFCPFYVSTKEEVIQHMTVHQQAPKGDSNNTDTSVTPSSLSACTSQAGIQGGEVQVKKEILPTDQDINTAVNEEVRPSDLSIPPPALDFTHLTEASVCWVLREDKLQKMLRCRYCPHVNLRRANMIEHEKMHLKRSSVTSSEAPVGQSHHAPYFCPDCSYVCNNAGVLSTHTKVHVPSYPQAYSFYDPYRSESMQIKEIIERYQLKLKVEETSSKSSSSKETVETGNENKLSGINVMSLLDPNQSLTDAVLAMKKKFNLELDGEPFAEPVDDSAESLSCSPLKQMNEGVDPSAMDTPNDKQLHFCHLCPARFLSRQELGIHSRFHNLYLIHKCDHCSYTARQRSHLQAHFKVHSEDYQDRTNALLKMYKVHKEFDMPRIVCANLKVGAIGNPWIVVTSSGPPEPPPAPKFACRKCPAAFFKNDALQAHLALHGSSNPHKCRICDYAVKTYGNLIKHMVSHGCKTSVAKKILQGRMEVPESLRSANTFNEFTPEPEMGDEENQSADTTINQYEEESAENFPCTEMDSNVKADACMETDRQLAVDENIGMRENDNSSSESLSPPKNSEFASGSPDFVYPTYCRNGRVKVKRYKCLKCPSAFEKKDQYLIHMGLHGSKQRYKCTKCDYSVKFFANHIQHLKRHQISEEAKGGSKDDSESSTNEGEESLPDDTENIPASLPSSPSRSAKTTGGKGEKLSVADKQAIMVLQQRRAKRSAISRESLDKNYWCSHCPYSSPRKDLVESHMRRHYLVSGVKNAFVCSHCDYSVPNKHFLRDHTKLHFDVSKAPKPDAFMICDGLELYASSGFLGKGKSKGKVLIFQDKGSNVASDRFLPPLASDGTEDSNDSASKIFINPTTLESENFGENGNKDIADASGDAENSTEHEKEPDIKHSEISSGGSGRDVTKGMGEPIIAKDSSEIIVVQANNSCSPTVVED